MESVAQLEVVMQSMWETRGSETEQRQWSWVIGEKKGRHPGDLPGSPVVKTLQFEFMVHGFSPWSGY